MSSLAQLFGFNIVVHLLASMASLLLNRGADHFGTTEISRSAETGRVAASHMLSAPRGHATIPAVL